MKETIADRANRYAKTHIEACKNWRHGYVKDLWTDSDGNLCIQYWDGSWWHYREKNGALEWW